MAATPVPVSSPASTPITSDVLATAAPAPTQPLWRFALIGLGPLAAMGIFALLVALVDQLS